MQEARFYNAVEDGVFCWLCPQECKLKEGQRGICGVRKVEDGKLVTLNYALCAAFAIDPIEKKPLYHFYPGWEIASLGTAGCNLRCSFCQNWSLAHGDRIAGMESITPQKLREMLDGRPLRQRLGAAYTYNEPTVWYEFVRECAEELAAGGYKNVLVSNGLINPEPLEELLPFVHGMNIDVKSFSDDFYRRYCGGKSYRDVLRTVERVSRDCHVEVTYLIITTLNDSPEEISQFIDWVASLDCEIPVHFSRYFPSHRLNLPPTPVETMTWAWEKAREKLDYVYLGNVMDHWRGNTFCPSCQQFLIDRSGFSASNAGLQGNKCKKCGHTIRLEGHIYGEEGTS